MKNTKNSGLTLIELLAAIVILGIISACVIGVVQSSMNISLSTNESMYASNITTSIHELWIYHSLTINSNYSTLGETLLLLYNTPSSDSGSVLSNVYYAADQGQAATYPEGDVMLAQVDTNTIAHNAYFLFFTSSWKPCFYATEQNSDFRYYAVITPYNYSYTPQANAPVTLLADISIAIYTCSTPGETSQSDTLLYSFTEVANGQDQA